MAWWGTPPSRPPAYQPLPPPPPPPPPPEEPPPPEPLEEPGAVEEAAMAPEKLLKGELGDSAQFSRNRTSGSVVDSLYTAPNFPRDLRALDAMSTAFSLRAGGRAPISKARDGTAGS